MSVFTHYAIVTGRLLPAFEKAIGAITSTIDPVNAESFSQRLVQDLLESQMDASL